MCHFERLRKKVRHGVHFQRIDASAQQAAAHNSVLARRIKLNAPHTVIKEIIAKQELYICISYKIINTI